MTGRRTSPSTPRAARTLVVGVDTGGTFTDIVYRDGATVGRFKLLSTPDDPARAVLVGLTELFGDRRADVLTYGTTVATNAMLERRGAPTVLLTTSGFEDVLEIGRQARTDLYALEPEKPEPLVGREARLGVAERMLFDGTSELRLTREEIERVATAVAECKPESIAVCLLHAHVEPRHEKRLGRRLAKLSVPVTLSHELSPEPGEYERTATTVANAYVRPKLARHIEGLASQSGAKTFRVLQSNGGATGAATAQREPVRTMLSGPAGGVAAARQAAARGGFDRAITLDMGGTSTDVALLDGEIPRRSVTEIGGVPVRSPCIDIHTVGAGGGSIAWVDEGGSLKVGPRSAGADPGPACYGRGEEPTVTDANLVLGRLRAESFLGGHMRLDSARARRALAPIAAAMGAGSVEQAAEGIVRVVEGNMERAIRVITVERGQDPRTAALVAFGGAAGLHACGLALELGIPNVLVPADPGLLSAVGVMGGRMVRDETTPLQLIEPSERTLRGLVGEPAAKAKRHLVDEGVAQRAIRSESFVRARYVGQSLEVEVPLTRDYKAAFHDAHERLYRHADRTRAVEVSGLRVTASTAASNRVTNNSMERRPRLATARAEKPRAIEHARVYVGGRASRVPVFRRETLAPGSSLRGPAVVVEYSSTVLIARAWSLNVDHDANLVLSHDRGPRG